MFPLTDILFGVTKYVFVDILLIDNVELPDNEFKLLNIVVEVAFKLLICVVWLFNIPKNVVEVAFKLLIDNVELVDNEFKLLLKLVFEVVFELFINVKMS